MNRSPGDNVGVNCGSISLIWGNCGVSLVVVNEVVIAVCAINVGFKAKPARISLPFLFGAFFQKFSKWRWFNFSWGNEFDIVSHFVGFP
jgi:hypothetical protein